MKKDRVLAAALAASLTTIFIPSLSSGVVGYQFQTIASGVGNEPWCGLVEDPQGNLYGRARITGSNFYGNIFEVAANTHAVTTLALFDGSDGAQPTSGMVFDSRGNLYGTTTQGGANGDGTVYEVPAGSNTIKDLVDFNTSTGIQGFGQLSIDPSGNLYGTTANKQGSSTLFKISSATNAVTVLANNLYLLYEGPLLDSSGNLFVSTTLDNGIYEAAAGSSSVTRIASIGGTNSNRPEGVLVEDSSGDLFGTTDDGGIKNAGTVFELRKGASYTITIANFSAGTTIPALTNVNYGMIMDPQGDLFGCTGDGGPNNTGTVFEIAAGTTTLNTLYTFTGGSDGAHPLGPLIMDSSGDLFGTTGYGNTVFELTPVPEPMTLSIAAISWVSLLQRKVKRSSVSAN